MGVGVPVSVVKGKSRVIDGNGTRVGVLVGVIVSDGTRVSEMVNSGARVIEGREVLVGGKEKFGVDDGGTVGARVRVAVADGVVPVGVTVLVAVDVPLGVNVPVGVGVGVTVAVNVVVISAIGAADWTFENVETLFVETDSIQ